MTGYKRDMSVCTCGSGVPCDGEESLNETFRVIRDLRADSSIKRYSFPSDEEMEEIVAAAEEYTGEWYHSEVTLNGSDDGSPLLTERTAFLKKRIRELGEEGGIYLSTSYDDPDADAMLAKMFANLRADDV